MSNDNIIKRDIMKIAVFFHDCEITSGATASMFTLVESWHHIEGVEIVAYASCEGTLFDKLRTMGIKCKLYKSINSRYNKCRNVIRQMMVRAYSLAKVPRYERYVKCTLVRELKEEGIDIVYANTSACVVGYYLRRYAEIPLVWHVREFGDLDQNVSYVGGKRQLFKMLGKSDLLVFISKAIAQYYESAAKKTRSIVVYDDLSVNYDIYQEKDFTRRPLRLLSCGALIPGKGHLDVIKAVGIARDRGCDVELNIAGRGDIYLHLCTNLIKELRLDNYVHLLGQVKDMARVRKNCEVGVVASRMEAFGRVTVEGMLAGMVMIGSNTGGTAELIENGRTGLSYRAGCVEELAGCIESVYNAPQRSARMAEEGYSFSKKFIEGNCARTIFEQLKKMVDE